MNRLGSLLTAPIQKIFLWMSEKHLKPSAGFFQLVRGLGFQFVKEEDILQAGVGVYSFKVSTKVQTQLSPVLVLVHLDA